MELLFALCVGVLIGGGVYLALRARTFPVVVGLTLISYGVNLFLFSSGRLTTGGQPILGSTEHYADPLPQALVLTAIVIGFAMTAFVVVLSLKSLADTGDDHVSGSPSSEPPKMPEAASEAEDTISTEEKSS